MRGISLQSNVEYCRDGRRKRDSSNGGLTIFVRDFKSRKSRRDKSESLRGMTYITPRS